MSTWIKYGWDLVVKNWMERRRLRAVLIALVVIGLAIFVCYIVYPDRLDRGAGLIRYGINAAAWKVVQVTQEEAPKKQDTKAALPNKTVPVETHNVALVRLKEVESRNSVTNADNARLKAQVKERDEKIEELNKAVVESKKAASTEKFSFGESPKESMERAAKLAVQVEELKRKVEELTFTNKRKAMAGFVQQLTELEKLSTVADRHTTTLADYNAVMAIAHSYNQLVTGLKKELAQSDPYVQAVNTVDASAQYLPVLAYLRATIPQLRISLEQRYLK